MAIISLRKQPMTATTDQDRPALQNQGTDVVLGPNLEFICDLLHPYVEAWGGCSDTGNLEFDRLCNAKQVSQFLATLILRARR